MSHALVFVLAPESLLPADGATARDLVDAQRFGLRSGVALRIFRTPGEWQGQVDDLVGQGKAAAAGLDPFGNGTEPGTPAPAGSGPGERRRLICDALVPHFEPRSHWLGVYQLDGDHSSPLDHPLDNRPEATLRCLSRQPTMQEKAIGLKFLQKQTALTPNFQAALADYCLALLNSNEFVYVD